MRIAYVFACLVLLVTVCTLLIVPVWRRYKESKILKEKEIQDRIDREVKEALEKINQTNSQTKSN